NVQDGDWSRHPIDRFVLATLEDRGLTPSPAAPRHTLLRRVHFELVGLPPTPEEMDRFLEDDSPDAYERAVDRLLESPRFGEHWGQHWLDLVRYAETCGHEFDYPIPHAWRYRDWVIQALNDDVPYDRFVLEQLAGDLVESPRRNSVTGVNESIGGTGMWYLSQGTHAPVDVREDEALRIENQIDVLGTAMLGLSVRCARCHDHKFDAITTEDYYALSGFLRSTRRQNAYLDPHASISKAVQERQAWNASQLSRIEMPDVAPDAAGSNGWFAEFNGDQYDEWFESGWAFGAKPTSSGTLVLEGMQPRITSATCAHSGTIAMECQGTLRSPTFVIDDEAIHLRARGHGGRMRLIIDGFVLGEYNGLLFESHIVDVDTDSWTNYTMDTSRYQGHQAHIALIDDGDGFLAVDAIRFGSIDDTTWNIDATQHSELPLTELDVDPPGIPHPVRMLAAEDGTPVDEYVFIKGQHAHPGPVVPRRFIASLGGDNPVPTTDGSGRLELAKQLLDEANPFPARVMVNRIWHHLMGRGLVSTPDEFGALGSTPSHPELLDYLATRFQSNWSIKSLVRDIVLSRTYCMSSEFPQPTVLEIDPDNILLHRAPRKRMSAQVLRDAILTVSGRLVTDDGGPSTAVHLTGFMTGRGRPSTSGPLDGDGRRTIYQEVRRNFLPPMLKAWDLPTACRPAGRRHVSNVPAQGLALLNDPFVAEQARVWSDRLLSMDELTDRDRVHRMYMEAFGRPPTEHESTTALQFIESEDTVSDSTAWADFGHVLFNSKEFVFID
ncbi:MAG: DUF1549 and DUF1553 domain-containing protein, partial [Phycisphaerales bacterium]|nr:DUF1549 and DUF1553 domain-containing protein [Phycisphaerales bacterium]